MRPQRLQLGIHFGVVLPAVAGDPHPEGPFRRQRGLAGQADVGAQQLIRAAQEQMVPGQDCALGALA